MGSTEWKRVKQLFHEALEKPGPGRREFVAAACGDDHELRRQVQALLDAHDGAGEFLSSPTVPEANAAARAAESPTESPPGERPGATIGPYRLLQVIGEGGFGVVYLAQQVTPVRRRVALKVIKHGMDTRQVIARFEAERQALALMEHPNIATVLDAGATESGRPYFVMELVDGAPLTEYCDTHRLTTGERLALFTQICSAVQHAHQKGIVHRDLKPSNVLVTLHDGKPLPKVIDFGIAKATSQQLTEKTLFTAHGQLVGTPVYMSPEQAGTSGLDVDTRSDVYSLGVLLYELLTGTTPFDAESLREAGFAEIQRVIREEEPPKPSNRLSTLGGAVTDAVARHRRTDPHSLSRLLRGDLDWIAMKALEKDRARRYDSPSELAADIGRHLGHEPVLAGPPSAAYRVGKFARRHRIGAGVGIVGIALLSAFAVTMAVQTARISRERDRANREAATSERVAEFLADMLGQVKPQAMGELLITDLRERIEAAKRKDDWTEEQIDAGLASFAEQMRGVNPTDAGLRLVDDLMLAPAAATVAERFQDDPRVAARLEYAIGKTYQRLGLYAQADPHLTRALQIDERELGKDHPETLRAENALAWLYQLQGRFDEAVPLALANLEGRRRVLGDDHPDTLTSMNTVAAGYRALGKYAEAERVLVEALEAQRRIHGEGDPNTLGTMTNLGVMYELQGRYEEAEPLYVETLALRRAAEGAESSGTLAAIGNLANLRLAQLRYKEAESLYLEKIEIQSRVLGGDAPGTLASRIGLAVIYSRQGRYDEAERLGLETIETLRRVQGDEAGLTRMAVGNLAEVYRNQGRHDEAEALQLQLIETMRRLRGDESGSTLRSMQNLAVTYRYQGRHDEAEALFLQVLATRRRVFGEDHPDTIGSLYELACFESVRGNTTRAMDLLREAVDAGWTNADWMVQDSDLVPLHGTEFDSLVEQTRRNGAAAPR